MKRLFILAFVLASSSALANDPKNEWHSTTLKEDTIKKIQTAQFNYKSCIVKEMQKKGYASIESRTATGAIIKRCEPVLAEMRKVYTDAKVPDVIADRHLKKMRIQLTRRLLKQLMYQEAAKAAAHSK